MDAFEAMQGMQGQQNRLVGSDVVSKVRLLLSACLRLCASLAFETKINLVLIFGWFQEAQ